MHAPPNFSKASQLVQTNGCFVPNLGIAGQFTVTVLDGPSFGKGEQRAADALPAKMFGDEPSFQIRNRNTRCALHVIRAHRDFDKTDQFSSNTRNDHDSRTRQQLFYLEAVPFWRTVRPKLAPEARPILLVSGLCEANFRSHAFARKESDEFSILGCGWPSTALAWQIFL